MAIQNIYNKIIEEISSDDFNNIKSDIISTCKFENFDILIELADNPIKDENNNTAFGSFCKCINTIKISDTQLIGEIGMILINNYINRIDKDNFEKIFRYYTLYVLAHEIHHAYLFNVKTDEYNKLKEEDKSVDYKDSQLEKYADDCAIEYLNKKFGNGGKLVGELGRNLRVGEYKKVKAINETNKECIEKFIIQELNRLIEMNTL